MDSASGPGGKRKAIITGLGLAFSLFLVTFGKITPSIWLQYSLPVTLGYVAANVLQKFFEFKLLKRK
jgi:hypothetical protein